MTRKAIKVALICFVLAGCQTDGVTPNSLLPVCTALIGPIEYNTYSKASARYAGPKLAPDLKRRNQVGKYLGCKQFR
jgi:hypothetical protein